MVFLVRRLIFRAAVLKRVLALGGLILLLFGAHPSMAAQPLYIAYPEYWPFFTQGADGRMTGFFYDIVTEALTNRMKMPTEWHAFPWARCQALVKSGFADAMITVPTTERLEYTRTHGTPFYNKTLNVFTYAGHAETAAIKRVKTVEDIARHKWSVITYLGNGWNDRHVRSKGVYIEETPTLKSVWRMLARRRGDLVIEWPGAAWPDIREAGLENSVVQTDVVLSEMPFHLLIRKGSPYADLLDRFGAVIEEMRLDGTMDRILRAYGIVGNSRIADVKPAP